MNAILDAAPAPSFHHRSLKAAGTYQLLMDNPFDQTTASGAGVRVVYEFNLSPKFTLGIDLAYRFHFGVKSLHRLGYGLLLKHYLTNPGGSKWFRPYLQYGLLLQQTRQAGRIGAGTAHDTAFFIGNDFQIGSVPLFAEISYHYSRLGYFDMSASNTDHFEVDLGVRFNW